MKGNKKCPNCGYSFEENTSLEDKRAKPDIGDISFCINCGQVSRFGEDMMIPLKFDDLNRETLMQILRIRKAWKEMKL